MGGDSVSAGSVAGRGTRPEIEPDPPPLRRGARPHLLQSSNPTEEKPEPAQLADSASVAIERQGTARAPRPLPCCAVPNGKPVPGMGSGMLRRKACRCGRRIRASGCQRAIVHQCVAPAGGKGPGGVARLAGARWVRRTGWKPLLHPECPDGAASGRKGGALAGRVAFMAAAAATQASLWREASARRTCACSRLSARRAVSRFARRRVK